MDPLEEKINKQFRSFLYETGMENRPIEIQKNIFEGFKAGISFGRNLQKIPANSATRFGLGLEIEGVKIGVSTIELGNHLNDRVLHHKERAEYYYQAAAQVRGLQPSPRSAGGETVSRSNDPAADYEQDAKRHKEKAQIFQFIRDHLIPNADYILTESDLIRFEFAGAGRSF